MSTKIIESYQYMVSFSNGLHYGETSKTIDSITALLSNENCPEGADEKVFQEFFRQVIVEECGYSYHMSDVIPDSIVFDYNSHERIEDSNMYVFGFGFNGDKIINEGLIVHVFNKVVIPLLKQHFNNIVIGNEIQTVQLQTVEGSINL